MSSYELLYYMYLLWMLCSLSWYNCVSMSTLGGLHTVPWAPAVVSKLALVGGIHDDSRSMRNAAASMGMLRLKQGTAFYGRRAWRLQAWVSGAVGLHSARS
ncbi:hypothetical protein CRG98_013758 [Punica granatum]|uniref:Uncharacterized protein n=1 Tax=Punica granatum TaxID=22663 RepID=A0A2I0KBF0_PUNGR|nr:hypothetical protein CRG98_013758 [Punica granatum]